jgi:hypothetical protein
MWNVYGVRYKGHIGLYLGFLSDTTPHVSIAHRIHPLSSILTDTSSFVQLLELTVATRSVPQTRATSNGTGSGIAQ